jgi:hypothetical protein
MTGGTIHSAGRNCHKAMLLLLGRERAALSHRRMPWKTR